jgi:hypothetical protein
VALDNAAAAATAYHPYASMKKNNIYAGMDGGFYRDNGGNWSRYGNGSGTWSENENGVDDNVRQQLESDRNTRAQYFTPVNEEPRLPNRSSGSFERGGGGGRR